MDVGQATAVQLAQQVAERLQRVGVFNPVKGAKRRDANADNACIPCGGNHGINHVQHQTCAVFDAAAVVVGALVAVGAEELVQQIAVGRVNFYAVKPGLQCVAGGLCVGFHHLRQFCGFQCTRSRGGRLVVAAVRFLHIHIRLGGNR